MGTNDPEVQRKWVAKRTREHKKLAIEYLGGKCKICGDTRDLHFHHVDPREKEYVITRRLTNNWEKLKRELDKCILLCPDCHKDHHHTKARHGTRSRYQYSGCRCEPCTFANTEYERERRGN